MVKTLTTPKSRASAAKPPAFRPVQLATLVDHVPAGGGWLHEMKYDGYRCLIAVGGGEARAYTRSGLDWSDKFAPVVAAARQAQGPLGADRWRGGRARRGRQIELPGAASRAQGRQGATSSISPSTC